MQTIKKITMAEVKHLIETNHVVVAYPRKNIVSVDGFKRYEATDSVCKYVVSFNKGSK